MEKAMRLFELLQHVRLAISRTLPATYWVVAEISEGRQNVNGHFYCKFIEKNAEGQDVASVSGVVWAGRYLELKQKFERETGQHLAAGIKVLVNVRVNYHERYGLSLVVNDIDSSFTLGDMVRRRRLILAQLAKDGVADMNKSLVLPRPLMRIAVITSETAAGYGDFCNHLKTNGAAFNFTTKLFPAVMQGDNVERSVISALNSISAEAGRWDAVAIIRGGGAVSDLNGFESYLLASNVAQFVLPIITGIGHERDETVIDLVANTRCKTPTAVADFLVMSAQKEIETLNALTTCLHRAATRNVSAQKQRMAYTISRIAPAFSHKCQISGYELERLLLRIPRAVRDVCARENSRCEKQAMKIEMLALNSLRIQDTEIARRVERLKRSVGLLMQTQKTRVEIFEKSIRLAGPERVFRLGFSLTTINGKAVVDAAQLKPGDRISTRFAKGEAVSVVEKSN